LFVFVLLSHHRRRVLHFGVTEHRTQEWTIQQMRGAFPWDQAPQYVLRDRDAIYGAEFAATTRDMGMEEVRSAPRCPGRIPMWNGWSVPSTGMSGSRDRVESPIVAPYLAKLFCVLHGARTHLSLAKDAPEPRDVEPPEQGRVVAIPQVGGLHHRYQPRAA
jgi:hypothetical protein